ncbi:hypothetical protein B0H19DRAFT_468197 [Mycena capillaripes]|nr:hypothetical protein B0H19DRAFT_468197 [Mycena capillaripes]
MALDARSRAWKNPRRCSRHTHTPGFVWKSHCTSSRRSTRTLDVPEAHSLPLHAGRGHGDLGSAQPSFVEAQVEDVSRRWTVLPSTRRKDVENKLHFCAYLRWIPRAASPPLYLVVTRNDLVKTENAPNSPIPALAYIGSSRALSLRCRHCLIGVRAASLPSLALCIEGRSWAGSTFWRIYDCGLTPGSPNALAFPGARHGHAAVRAFGEDRTLYAPLVSVRFFEHDRSGQRTGMVPQRDPKSMVAPARITV